MICAWKELLGILPAWMRTDVDRLGRNSLQELRLRLNDSAELCLKTGQQYLNRNINVDDLNFVINAASKYSPWSAASMAKGYLTAPGGHRIGICGTAVCKDGQVSGIRDISSLCIRVARDFPGIAQTAATLKGSILILGAPGWGKTTLLRDLIRKAAERECVGVIDERGELFPEGLQKGRRMDVLTGAEKRDGIDRILRTMGPSTIAVDEITAPEDSEALLQASNCGVRLLATAHASSAADFLKRKVYRPLVEYHVFDDLIILRSDKTFFTERMTVCR